MFKSLFFLFVFALLQIHSAEATVRFAFERKELSNSTRRLTEEEGTAEAVDTHEKCPPSDYVKVEKAFKQALKTLEPDLSDSEVDSWAAPKIAEIEELNDEVCHHGHGLELTLHWLFQIDWETIWESIDWGNIDWNDFDWGLDALSNGVSTHSMKCIHDEDDSTPQRNRELTVATPEEVAEHERHLQMCPGWCYTEPSAIIFYECWGCFRRRERELQQAEVDLELANLQNAVDAMYNFCLADVISCMDCSTATLCTDVAVDPNGDQICVGPSCLADDSCESGL